MLDLELLHNFCTSTYLTFYHESHLKNLWKITVPQLGFQYDFVMRGILAVSALHIAHFVPDKNNFYMSQALMQYQSGLQTATSMLARIDDSNCEAVWIFSNFALFFTMATARQSSDFLMIGRDSIGSGWLELVKGSWAILNTSHEQLRNGCLGPTFRIGAVRANLREEVSYDFTGEQDPTQELRGYMEYSKLPPENYDMCIHAIDELRKSFAMHYKTNYRATHEFGDIFIWLFRVNNGYLELVREHCQEAVAIFAYFCVLLKALDAKWWIQGSSVHLIGQIWDALDEEHRLWIRWPIDEIGWIPSSSMSRYNSQVNTPAAVATPGATPAYTPVTAVTPGATPAYMSPPAPAP